MKKLSIVIPVYYNEQNLEPLYADLKEKVFGALAERGWEYELIFVDDGSKDGSFEVMSKLAKSDKNIVNVRLSRNFGSHAAILAGLSQASGNCATSKAADLQEPSELILQMLDEYEKNFNVVLAVREGRDEGIVQSFFANFYYSLIRVFALKNMPKQGFDCFLIDRKVIDVLTAMEEKNTTLMGQILWSGFRTSQVGYVRRRREIGKSRWTLRKKLKLVTDSILGFSYTPIKVISGMGVALFFASFIWAVIVVICKLTGNIPVEGYTTLAIILLCGFGLVLLSLGILGEYMWRMFDASRKRPPFIIEEVETGKNTEKKGKEQKNDRKST
ncbi:MAG: glycosyltransferase family 2 protein [Ruminococcaceae bacterium]|nr:glycosyltransferase family 2 protein [Oscillospiraceae bacterium]